MGSGASRERRASFDGTLSAVYLGSVPVRAKSGMDVCKHAVATLLSQHLPRKQVMFSVDQHAVSIMDKQTIVKRLALADITFVAIDPDKASIVSVFARNRSLNITNCFSFEFRPAKRALHVTSLVHDAITKFRATKKKSAARVISNKQKENKGEQLSRYPCDFVGRVPVNSRTGVDTIQQAVNVMLKEWKAKGSPQRKEVELVIYQRRLCVEHALATSMRSTKSMSRSQKLHQSSTASKVDTAPLVIVRLTSITFFAQLSDKIFAFIVYDNRLGETWCCAVQLHVMPSGALAIGQNLKSAQRAFRQQLAKEGKLTVLKETSKLDVVVGCTYLGTRSTQHRTGDNVLRQTASELKKDRDNHINAVIKLSEEGIRIFDGLTNEPLHTFLMRHVLYCGSAGENLFGLIGQDTSLGLRSCVVLQLTPQTFLQVEAAFKEGFERLKIQGKRQTDPFVAIGERVPAPASLFKRQIHRSDLKAVCPIGAGQFGQVYLADHVTAKDGDKPVLTKRAVKTLRGEASTADRDEFVHESEVMLELDHPSIVSLIGVAVQQRPWLMVLEYLHYGDLRKLLRACRTKDITLTLAEELSIAVQPAAGVAYLAEQRFVHADLAARNCLVGHGNVVKIADFGLTRRLDSPEASFVVDEDAKLPIKWCALETLRRRCFTLLTDVWSLGILIWEIFHYGEMPYPGVSNSRILPFLESGKRLDFPSSVPDRIRGMLGNMWSLDASRRPSAEELRATMMDELRQMPERRDVRSLGELITSTADKKDLRTEDAPAPMPLYEYQPTNLIKTFSSKTSGTKSNPYLEPSMLDRPLDLTEEDADDEDDDDNQDTPEDQTNQDDSVISKPVDDGPLVESHRDPTRDADGEHTATPFIVEPPPTSQSEEHNEQAAASTASETTPSLHVQMHYANSMEALDVSDGGNSDSRSADEEDTISGFGSDNEFDLASAPQPAATSDNTVVSAPPYSGDVEDVGGSEFSDAQIATAPATPVNVALPDLAIGAGSVEATPETGDDNSETVSASATDHDDDFGETSASSPQQSMQSMLADAAPQHLNQSTSEDQPKSAVSVATKSLANEEFSTSTTAETETEAGTDATTDGEIHHQMLSQSSRSSSPLQDASGESSSSTSEAESVAMEDTTPQTSTGPASSEAEPVAEAEIHSEGTAPKQHPARDTDSAGDDDFFGFETS